MGGGASRDITAMLVAWSKGDEAALESLIPLLGQELRRTFRGNSFHLLGLNTRRRDGSPGAWSGNGSERWVLPLGLRFDTFGRAPGYLPSQGAR